MEVEFGLPQWSFGLSTYTFLGDGRIACFYTRDGRRQLALLRAGDRRPTDIAPEFSFVSHPTRLGDKLAFIGGGDTEAHSVGVLGPASGSSQRGRCSRGHPGARAYLSAASTTRVATAR